MKASPLVSLLPLLVEDTFYVGSFNGCGSGFGCFVLAGAIHEVPLHEVGLLHESFRQVLHRRLVL